MMRSSPDNDFLKLAIKYASLVIPESKAHFYEEKVFLPQADRFTNLINTQKPLVKNLSRQVGFNPEFFVRDFDPRHEIHPLFNLKLARFTFAYENIAFAKHKMHHPLNQTALYQDTRFRKQNAVALVSQVRKSPDDFLQNQLITYLVTDRIDDNLRPDIIFPRPGLKLTRDLSLDALDNYIVEKQNALLNESRNKLSTIFSSSKKEIINPDAKEDLEILKQDPTFIEQVNQSLDLRAMMRQADQRRKSGYNLN